MSIVEVVHAGWRLYWCNFSRYVAIALRGTSWVFFPTLLLTMLLLWIINQGVELRDFSGLSALFVPAFVVLLLWCKAQSLGCLAGISRLAYQSLHATYPDNIDSEGNDPGASLKGKEALAQSLRFTHSRRFSFLGSVLIQAVILGIVVVAFMVAFFLSIGTTFAGMGMVPGAEPSIPLFFFGGGSALVSVAIFAGIYVWLVVRMLMAEQAIAIEREVGAIASIGRSWQMTRGNVLRTTCVATLTFLISLPVAALTWLAAQSVSLMTLERVGVRLKGADFSSIDFLPLTVSYLIMILVSMVGGIITQPLFRTVFTTLYLDARKCEESIRA